MRCGICKAQGHNARLCPKRPGGTTRVEIPRHLADHVLPDLRALARANVWASNFLESVMLSCYLQGALHALTLSQDYPELLKKTPERSLP